MFIVIILDQCHLIGDMTAFIKLAIRAYEYETQKLQLTAGKRILESVRDKGSFQTTNVSQSLGKSLLLP